MARGAAALLAAALCGMSLPHASAIVGGWTQGATMPTERRAHATVRLADGRALVLGGVVYGGFVRSTVAYTPSTDAWATLAPMPGYHAAGLTATSLNDGRVLVAGGGESYPNEITNTALLFNPVSNSWAAAASMAVARAGHSALRLADGRVFVTGGTCCASVAAELFDAATNAWTPTSAPPWSATPSVLGQLADGRVLVLADLTTSDRKLEAWDPSTDAWQPLAPLPDNRTAFAAAALPGDRLLIAGGRSLGPSSSYADDSTAATAYVYDAASNTWLATDSLHEPREHSSATTLNDGRVLVVGGQWWDGINNREMDSGEVFDPATGAWEPVPAIGNQRLDVALLPLADGRALATGGHGDGFDLATTSIFNPAGPALSGAPSLTLTAYSQAWAGGLGSAGSTVRDSVTHLALANQPIRYEITDGPDVGQAGYICGTGCPSDTHGETKYGFENTGGAGYDAIRVFLDANTNGSFDPGEASATTSVIWHIRETSLKIDPALARTSPPVISTGLGAQLRWETGYATLPVAGKVISFTDGLGEICRGTTDAQGWARCGGTAEQVRASKGFRAAYAGDAFYRQKSGAGSAFG